jgi:hypothetical protein
MRTKLTVANPEAALGRILDALASELITVSDAEILEAAKDLGMNPMMKGSAAFIGLRTPAIADFADFFDPEILKGLVLARAQAFAAEEATPKGKPRRIKRSVAVRKDRTDQ